MWIIKIVDWDIGGMEWRELYRTEYDYIALDQLKYYTAEHSTDDVVMTYE